eukprot:scaffold201_cov48-Cyclotella_meneghiniana.AAC.1
MILPYPRPKSVKLPVTRELPGNYPSRQQSAVSRQFPPLMLGLAARESAGWERQWRCGVMPWLFVVVWLLKRFCFVFALRSPSVSVFFADVS